MVLRPILLIVTLLSLFAGSASAERLRYAAVFTETLEGTARPVSALETALVRALIQKGLVFIDEAQSRKIRAVTDAGRLIGGQPIPEVVTSLDADVLIVGTVELVRIPTTLLSSKVSRYDALAKVRVIAVDTATVLASLEARGEGMGYSPQGSGDAAAAKAAEALVDQIVATGSQRIELVIHGVPNVSAGEQMLSAVKALGGVKSAVMLHAGSGTSKIEIESDVPARELALGLDSADLALSVTGYSKQAIRASYDVARPGRLTLIVPPIEPRAGGRTWVGGALGEIIAESLVGSGLIARGSDSIGLGSDPKKWRPLLDRAGVSAERVAVLLGSYRGGKDPKTVEIEAKLVAAASGALIASVKHRCATAELNVCGGALGEQLAQGMKKQLEHRTDLFGPSRFGSPKSALSIAKLELENVFPAQLSGKRPIGTVALHNGGPTPIEDVIVGVKLHRFAEVPLSIPAGTIAPGATIHVPLELVLDRTALLTHDENRPAVATVEVEYADGPFRAHLTRNAAVVVYGRYAMSWKTPESIASFVTARDDAIVRLAKELHAAIPEAARAQPLSVPVALFNGLGRLGLSYAPDPSSPFGADTLDYVAFPSETLVTKSGDCDDLVVLYASLVEALGRHALIASVPGHVFVAVSTGLPEQSAHRLAVEQGELIAHRGQLFVPLETTKLKVSFREAWRDAAATLSKWRHRKDQLGLIEVRAAWSKFPPTDLAPATPAVARTDWASLGASITADLEGMETERVKGLGQRIEESGSNPLKKATLLAQMERYDEARGVLSELVSRGASNFAALNNLGNVEMMVSSPAKARELYRSALRHTPQSEEVPVRINAAISAFVLGDENEFADHIVACLDNGGEEAVRHLALGGIAIGGGSRGASGEQMRIVDLEGALGRALAKRKRTLENREDRASNASDVLSIGAYLHWLEPRSTR